MIDVSRTTIELLDRAARRWPDKVAILEEGERLSFNALRSRARDLARGIIAQGLEPGQRFAIWGPNSTGWILAALAGQMAGGVLVPINTRFKGPEAADILRRSGSRLLFVVPRFLEVDYPALLRNESLPELESVVGMDTLDELAVDGQQVSNEALDVRAGTVTGESLCDILYTSGTTGAPKGVMCTHGQNVAVFEAWSRAVGLSADDRYLIVNPFFHSFGYKAGWLAALLCGSTMYPMAVFDAERVVALIENEGISMLPGAPTIFQSLLSLPDIGDRNLSSLRCAVTGAASVPVQLVRDMRERLGFREVYTAYGLTESTGVVSLCSADDDFETIANTSGRAMEGVEVRIRGEDGSFIAPGESGEIWVRGFNVMKGYLDDPEATRAAITEDGWLRTGDVGTLDERGYLRITDRLKDMFICGGFNCYPAEIEHTLLRHPDIADVAVIGAPDERLGEVAHAYAVPAPDASRDDAAIITWARQHMANYKVPRQVYWVESLPRNAAGKVQKFLLGGR
ncbi:MAG: FadD3 family acyl-CoA ligase [Pseudomonadota bacterium]